MRSRVTLSIASICTCFLCFLIHAENAFGSPVFTTSALPESDEVTEFDIMEFYNVLESSCVQLKIIYEVSRQLKLERKEGVVIANDVDKNELVITTEPMGLITYETRYFDEYPYDGMDSTCPDSRSWRFDSRITPEVMKSREYCMLDKILYNSNRTWDVIADDFNPVSSNLYWKYFSQGNSVRYYTAGIKSDLLKADSKINFSFVNEFSKADYVDSRRNPRFEGDPFSLVLLTGGKLEFSDQMVMAVYDDNDMNPALSLSFGSISRGFFEIQRLIKSVIPDKETTPPVDALLPLKPYISNKSKYFRLNKEKTRVVDIELVSMGRNICQENSESTVEINPVNKNRMMTTTTAIVPKKPKSAVDERVSDGFTGGQVALVVVAEVIILGIFYITGLAATSLPRK